MKNPVGRVSHKRCSGVLTHFHDNELADGHARIPQLAGFCRKVVNSALYVHISVNDKHVTGFNALAAAHIDIDDVAVARDAPFQ